MTDAFTTPGTLSNARSTWSTQLAPVMPLTGMAVRSVFMHDKAQRAADHLRL